ncbi:MAG: hypothetical protein GXP29_08840, partial [Planctomycetes bacterium]|nr:hypothetical protein [Planctomycetota bacterium]
MKHRPDFALERSKQGRVFAQVDRDAGRCLSDSSPRLNRFGRATACAIAALIMLTFASRSSAIPQALSDVIPPDHLFYIASDYSSNGAKQSTPSAPLIAAGSELLLRFGGRKLTEGPTGPVLDALASLAILNRFPFAIVITDASARQIGAGSHRLGDLQVSIIVQTEGENSSITRRIQALLTRWTSTDSAKITRENAHGTDVYTLHDERFPSWCVVRWAAMGRFYVVTLGDRAFKQTANSIERQGAPTAEHTRLRRWRKMLGSAASELELHINLDAIRNALSPVMKGRP